MNISGGLLIVVLAALWFFVLVPSWSNRNSESRGRNAAERKFQVTVERRQNIDAKSHFGVSKLAIRNKNISRGRVIFSLIFVAATVTSIATLLTFVPSVSTISTLAVASIMMLLSVLALRSINRSRRQITTKFAQSRSSISAQMSQYIRESAAQAEKEAEIVDERAWMPNALPASLASLRVGAIEATELAEVVAFEERKIAATDKKLESETLDLILKRRRAN